MNFGLHRITSLLSHLGDPQNSWQAIHVAGTNGKGSVCAYISAVLDRSGIRTGRFTSPHLVQRWDGIVLNEKIVEESKFATVENRVRQVDKDNKVNATSFELLTATAFELFRQSDVEIGIVEVGLGGRLDATNVFTQPAAAVITRIGLDHKEILGDTVELIAAEKAGIIKAHSPCIIDATNENAIQKVLLNTAKSVKAKPILLTQPHKCAYRFQERHFVANVTCALLTLQTLRQNWDLLSDDEIFPIIDSVRWKGRYDNIDVGAVVGKSRKVFVDGAHNIQAAEALSRYIHDTQAKTSEGVTWIFAISNLEKARAILQLLLRPCDSIIAVEFSCVEGMPWVRSVEASAIVEIARELLPRERIYNCGLNLMKALSLASSLESELIVACGSLYLISDLCKLV